MQLFEDRRRLWALFAEQFGLEIETVLPQQANLPPDFGPQVCLTDGKRKVLVFPSNQSVIRVWQNVVDAGFSFSCVDPSELTCDAARASAAEMLEDWGLEVDL
jgi:hypothetical protein